MMTFSTITEEKTSKYRSDSAFFEIRMPQFIKSTLEKYLSKDTESSWLFDFQDHLRPIQC